MKPRTKQDDMSTNDIADKAPLLDQTYFALHAKGFAASQNMFENLPAPTDLLRGTLAEISADILAIEKEAEGQLDALLVEATEP